MADKEIVKDFLKDRWILFSTQRGKRRFDLHSRRSLHQCVFCPGNERLTPPSVLLLAKGEGGFEKSRSENRDLRVKGWIIRVIPNLHPAVRSDILTKTIVDESADRIPAVGHHEIIIESPHHFQRLEKMSLIQLQNVFSAYKDRLGALSSEEYVRYISIFRNYKKDAGASQRHPHSQLITLPFTPAVIAQEVESLSSYSKKNGSCALCDLIEAEARSKRLIWEGHFFTVLAPWFSIQPYETWIIPKRHTRTFSEINIGEMKELSAVFKSCFLSFSKLLNDPPHNFWIHISPTGVDDFHWHIEIIPKLGEIGGLEMSTAVYINVLLPEVAAKSLRQQFLPSIRKIKP